MRALSSICYFLSWYCFSLVVGFVWCLLSLSISELTLQDYTVVDLLVAGHIAAMFAGLPISIIAAINMRKSYSPFRRDFSMLVRPSIYKKFLLKILFPLTIFFGLISIYFVHPLALMVLAGLATVLFFMSKGRIDWVRT